jgi:hypothetical protein
MITAIVSVLDDTGKKAIFRKDRDGHPNNVTDDVWDIANGIVQSGQELSPDVLIDGLACLTPEQGWTRYETPPKDLVLACDYLFEAEISPTKRLKFRECRQG